MPMYDYICGHCGHHFEELIMSSAIQDSDISCPKCESNQSKKQLSAPAVSMGSSFDPACAKPGCATPASAGFG